VSHKHPGTEDSTVYINLNLSQTFKSFKLMTLAQKTGDQVLNGFCSFVDITSWFCCKTVSKLWRNYPEEHFEVLGQRLTDDMINCDVTVSRNASINFKILSKVIESISPKSQVLFG